MGKIEMIKGRDLRGNSRVPDQLSTIKISSIIKNIYTPSNQYPALQFKNPCCHGNCKRSQLWHSKAITETSLLWNNQQSRVLYNKCLSIFNLKTKCYLKSYFQILPQISCKFSLKPDHIYRHCLHKTSWICMSYPLHPVQNYLLPYVSSRYIWYKVYISDLHCCTLWRGTEQTDLKKPEETKD